MSARIAALRTPGPVPAGPVPVDLVTASGSGLDPDISPAAALYQVPRIAAQRGLPPAELEALISHQAAPRTLGLLGEPRVNVLRLNIALDSMAAQRSR
jgi:K+-transporting ATPase ATPase C chain